MANTFKLNKTKINNLFRNIRKLQGGKNLLCKQLHINYATLNEYLRIGGEYLEQYEELFEEVLDFDEYEIDDEFENSRDRIRNLYLDQTGFEAISDKNRNAFEVFFIQNREQYKENEIRKIQDKIMEDNLFSDDKEEDKKIKLYIAFKLIYDRAQMSLDKELLYLKERYAKTSSKHVGILVKDLERRNKEDFGEEKNDKETTKQITINNTTNLLALCREYEQAKGLLPNSNVNVHNSDDIIDVEAGSDE